MTSCEGQIVTDGNVSKDNLGVNVLKPIPKFQQKSTGQNFKHEVGAQPVLSPFQKTKKYSEFLNDALRTIFYLENSLIHICLSKPGFVQLYTDLIFKRIPGKFSFDVCPNSSVPISTL